MRLLDPLCDPEHDPAHADDDPDGKPADADADAEANDPFTFEWRCLIERTFPAVGNAYDLTMDEFVGRIDAIVDHNQREAEASAPDGLGAVMLELDKQMRRATRKNRDER